MLENYATLYFTLVNFIKLYATPCNDVYLLSDVLWCIIDSFFVVFHAFVLVSILLVS